jgi:hypothetical protein
MQLALDSNECKRLAALEKTYENWVRCYLDRYPNAVVARYDAVPTHVHDVDFHAVKPSLARCARSFTLFPNTNPQMFEWHFFLSEVDAILNDWYKVGSDLYRAMQKSKMPAPPCAGTAEDESATTTRAR